MPARNGPYRPSAPTVPELAAGAVVVRRGRLLVLHEQEEDRWCLPKGHVEANESLEETALREVREETGLADVRLEGEVGEVSYRFFSPTRGVNVHKTSVYFHASSAEGEVHPEPIFDRFEWCPFEQALTLLRYDTDRAIVQRVIAGSTGGGSP